MAKKIIKSGELAATTSLEDRLKTGMAAAAPAVTEPSRVMSRSVLEAKARAEQVIDEAQAQSGRIRAEAEHLLAEVDAVRQQARDEGYAAGREQGYAEAMEFLTRFERLKEDFYATAEVEVHKLVLTIAEKVVGRLMEVHGELIKAVVKQAIEATIGDRVVVRLNPDDYRLVVAAESEFRDLLDRTKRLQFREDEAITRGGCVVETEVGTIDAQLETQLRAIRKALEL
ncbi:MAG: hypothetical protein HY696_01445 [Deltaproteobacteria bacterium]|nr:hypothetical protein [Deltaproteobacteria bacterium]